MTSPRWCPQVWYRRIRDEAANSSLDVDFYFPVDQWLVAREDYHRCAGSWPKLAESLAHQQ